MEGGLTSPRTEGTPQGNPLSPLLSNILLNELDKELSSRGHNFVRYGDDCSIYVSSEKAATRSQSSITSYIEGKLKLKVNKEKTRISRPMHSTLLGFSFYRSKEKWEIRISPKSIKRIKAKLKEKTRRRDPANARVKIAKIEPVIRGWVNYFIIAKAKSVMRRLDEFTRTRLRMNEWKSWKRIRARIRRLRSLGIAPAKAYFWANSRLGYCRLAHSPILFTTLNIHYWQAEGYFGFEWHYTPKRTDQPNLF